MTQRLAPRRDALAVVTTLAVAAGAGCQRSSPITEPASVASVTVSPPSIEIEVGQSAQLAATPRDRNGHPLSGRPVAWATSDSAVATVDGAGRVTGVTAGSATITATSEGVSGTAAVTVTPRPPPSGSCLDQTGPSLTLSGLQTSAFSNRNLAPSTKLDAATAQFTTAAQLTWTKSDQACLSRLAASPYQLSPIWKLEMEIMKYRALARNAGDAKTTQRIKKLVAELEQKLRQIGE